MTRRWGRYEIDDGGGVRAVWPEVDAGVRLVVDGRPVHLRPVDVRERADQLSWTLAGDGVEVTCGAFPDGTVQALVAGAGCLQRVELERWTAGPGLGQPTIGDGWFAALEHPAAEGLGLALDVDLSRGSYLTPPLVVREASRGQELSALWDELDRVRARPPGLVVLANNWYQLGYVGRMDEASVGAEMDGFRDDVPLDLDCYCLDDPWDGSWTAEAGIWGRLDPTRFPLGLGALQARGPVGLWISPWGGYFDRHDARVAWGREHGYEVTEGTWPRLCLAGDRYRAHVASSMAAFTAAGVGYWKVDGVHFDCGARDHGHGGQTDQMDRFAALLGGLRTPHRETVLVFTSGSNPSPWWLQHADFVWRGGLDDDAPAEFGGGRHDRFATYIDSCLDALRPTSVPVSSIVTFSVVENQAVAYRTDGGGMDEWERHCWFLAGRGTHHHDLYVAPDSLSRPEWDALARVLAWARAHEKTLARSRMVGGRPQAGEPYGFVSTSAAEGQAVVCVRNPSAAAQGVRVDVGGEMTDVEPVWGPPAVADGAGYVAAELGPFEVALVTGRWRPGSRPDPGG